MALHPLPNDSAGLGHHPARVSGCGWVCPSGRPIHHPNERKALRPGQALCWVGRFGEGQVEGGQNSSQRVETEMQEVRRGQGLTRSTLPT